MPAARVPLADGAEIACTIEGNGRDVLLVSGLGGTAAFWAPVVADLEGRYRLIAFDARGIGGSSRGTAPVDIDRLAADCTAILDHLGIERATIVGHSTGGVIAQTMGLLAPGRMRGLCLGGTWAKADRYMHALFRSRLEVLRKAPEEYAVGTVFLGYPAGWLAEHWQLHEAALAGAPVAPRAQLIVAERIAALLAFDRTSELGRLAMPVLVSGAKDDQIVPAYLQCELASLIPGARLHMLDGGGHFYPSSRRADFTAMLGAWLDTLPT
jgi:pimeloyl-ACP methyl ester carboxylesterase